MEDEPIINTLRKGQFGGTLSWLAADGTDEEQTDGMIADATVAELKHYKAEDRAFFLAVGLFRPHTPFVAPKKYFDMYPIGEIVVPEVPEGYEATIPKPALNSIRRKKEQINLPDATAREVIQSYYASITFADAQVGKILDALEETGLDENTVVTFTSDHGYHMGEQGHWQKTTLFDNATRVPFIVADPDQKEKGAVSNCPVEMVDFYPTLAARCGLKPPSHLSGVDLSPVLEDASAKPRESALTQYSNGYSLRTERYRYTEWGEGGKDGIEFYDHESDSEEMKNLAGDPSTAAVITELKRKLAERVENQKVKPEGIEQIQFENRRRVR